jgi:UDP:flavonoid glycosyltransferase YjiC (YdhE family)
VKIGIATVGSRGDVQPYLALGQGLRRAGHDVRIIVDRTFTDLVHGAGLEIAPVAADPAGALADDLAGIGDSPIRMIGWVRRHLRPMVRGYFADLRDASEGLDVLLYSVLNLAAQHLAELGRIQGLAAYLQPVTPTRAFPHPLVPRLPGWLPWRGAVNRLGYGVAGRGIYSVMRRLIDEARREVLGLGPLPAGYYRSLETSRAPILYGYSAHVLPKPADWGDWLHITGYWFVESDAGWTPPRELQEFLDAGPTPVYVGFGSMGESGSDPATELAMDALGRAGVRGILLGARGRPPVRLAEAIVAISEAPHDWLFPRCAAVIHHGGAGTTAAGLRAGVPAVTVPFFADQFFWGWRLSDLGVGARPIRRRKLTASRLAEAIRLVTVDEGIRAAARHMGDRVRSEDGVGTAVRLIERLSG